MANDDKSMQCAKCSSPNFETFQRGPFISGTRCMGCKHETLAKIIRTVGDMRMFLDNVPEDTPLSFQDDGYFPRLELHFKEQISKAEKVKMWRGVEAK